MKIDCYCNSNLPFSECCEPIILGKISPSSAEKCMRSRFTSFVLCKVDYLIKSTHPSKRKYYSKKELELWSKENTWQKLEIISSSITIVEFKAYYLDDEKRQQIHHEKSNFKKENDFWYFFEGEVF